MTYRFLLLLFLIVPQACDDSQGSQDPHRNAELWTMPQPPERTAEEVKIETGNLFSHVSASLYDVRTESDATECRRNASRLTGLMEEYDHLVPQTLREDARYSELMSNMKDALHNLERRIEPLLNETVAARKAWDSALKESWELYRERERDRFREPLEETRLSCLRCHQAFAGPRSVPVVTPVPGAGRS